jgi:hypothetical protein
MRPLARHRVRSSWRTIVQAQLDDLGRQNTVAPMHLYQDLPRRKTDKRDRKIQNDFAFCTLQRSLSIVLVLDQHQWDYERTREEG